MHDDCTNAIRRLPAFPVPRSPACAEQCDCPTGRASGASTDLRIAYGIWIRLTPNHLPMKKHATPMTAPAARAGAEINWSSGRA